MTEAQRHKNHRLFQAAATTGYGAVLEDIGGDLFGGQAGAGKDRQFLALDQGVEAIDGGEAGLDKLFGPGPAGGIDRHPGHRGPFFRERGRQPVNGQKGAVKDPVQHIERQGRLLDGIGEDNGRLLKVKAPAFPEYLDQYGVTVNQQHFTLLTAAIGADHPDHLAQPHRFDLLDHEQLAADRRDRFITMFGQSHELLPLRISASSSPSFNLFSASSAQRIIPLILSPVSSGGEKASSE